MMIMTIKRQMDKLPVAAAATVPSSVTVMVAWCTVESRRNPDDEGEKVERSEEREKMSVIPISTRACNIKYSIE